MKQPIRNGHRPAVRLLMTVLVAITLVTIMSTPSTFAESAATPGVVFQDLSAGELLARQAERLSNFRTPQSAVSVVERGSAPNVQVVVNITYTDIDGVELLVETELLDVTLYEEDGTPLGGYGVFSAHDVFEIDISATTTNSFGVVELDFGPGRSGVVSVRHSAFGRFSVGHEAFCSF